MNNFNALSQYIASVNQAVNSLAKNNVDIMNRLKNVEGGSSGNVDYEKIMRLIEDSVSKAVNNAKSEILSEVSASVSKLSERITADLESKLASDLENKLASELESKLATMHPQQEIDEIVIPELAPEVVNLSVADADDDIIIGMKKEEKAPRRRGKARA